MLNPFKLFKKATSPSLLLCNENCGPWYHKSTRAYLWMKSLNLLNLVKSPTLLLFFLVLDNSLRSPMIIDWSPLERWRNSISGHRYSWRFWWGYPINKHTIPYGIMNSAMTNKWIYLLCSLQIIVWQLSSFNIVQIPHHSRRIYFKVIKFNSL